jgi:hypothetical protein
MEMKRWVARVIGSVAGVAAWIAGAAPAGAASFTGLGDLPGGSFYSVAYGVSADGSVVVGQGNSASGGEAFIWGATYGMRNLKDVLTNDYGLGSALTGWTLTGAPRHLSRRPDDCGS